MSLRGVTWPVCACSGAMYSGVPSTEPVAVFTPPADLAMPKSISLILPSFVSMTLAGLMSRWTMPRRWA